MTADADDQAAGAPAQDPSEPASPAPPRPRSSTRRRSRKKKTTAESGGTASEAAPGAAAAAAKTPSGTPPRARKKAASSSSRRRKSASTATSSDETTAAGDSAHGDDPPKKKSTGRRRKTTTKAKSGASAQGKTSAGKSADAGAETPSKAESDTKPRTSRAKRGRAKTTTAVTEPRARKRVGEAVPDEAAAETVAKQKSAGGRKRATGKRAAGKSADAKTAAEKKAAGKKAAGKAATAKQAASKEATKKSASATDASAAPAKKKSRRASSSKRASTSEPKKKAAAAKKPATRGKKAAAAEPTKTRSRRSSTQRTRAAKVRKEMIISVDVGEQRVAVIEDDTVVEVYLERRGERSVAGNIYKGIVDNVLPGMEASFVDIGLERNGFLYVGEIVVPEGEEGRKKRGRRIQDLIARGEEVLVQAVKDPMGTKGARLTTEISLPGRFVVFVPYGEGIGISRRLEDEERERLKKLCKGLELPQGGIIVRTAAEGASESELEGDLALLRKLWATILGRSNRAEPPTLVYREAELPLRLVRDLFIRDFEHLVVDHEQTHRRLVGYLKRTSPELAARVELDAAAESIMQRQGVEKALRSTLNRNVPLPSGGSLVFDYAEALTVIDVNTGRFVGSRGSSTSLEDTITQNNLEASREIVRQLRLRDIGGIIVIDFIDMANARNRKAVELELAKELARDRTKTYVVEISPLGLVEMTRQNVTDGPREILTHACPTCEGDGVVLSEESVVIDVERALRSRAVSSKAESLLVELNERVARRVIGAGGERLAEFEADVGRRVFVESREDVPLDYFDVLAEGTSAEMEHRGLPVSPGEELELKLEGVYLLDNADAIGRLDGYVVVVAGAGKRVGEKVSVVIDRVTRTVAYASLRAAKAAGEPHETLTAEAAIGVDGATGELDDVELPPAARGGDKDAGSDGATSTEDGLAEAASSGKTPSPKRRRRRRSSRTKATSTTNGATPSDDDAPAGEQTAQTTSTKTTSSAKKPAGRRRKKPAEKKVTEPASEAEATVTTNGAEPAKPRRRRRRSTKSKATEGASADAARSAASAAPSEPDTPPSGDASGENETGRRRKSSSRRRRSRSAKSSSTRSAADAPSTTGSD